MIGEPDGATKGKGRGTLHSYFVARGGKVRGGASSSHGPEFYELYTPRPTSSEEALAHDATWYQNNDSQGAYNNAQAAFDPNVSDESALRALIQNQDMIKSLRRNIEEKDEYIADLEKTVVLLKTRLWEAQEVMNTLEVQGKRKDAENAQLSLILTSHAERIKTLETERKDAENAQLSSSWIKAEEELASESTE